MVDAVVEHLCHSVVQAATRRFAQGGQRVSERFAHLSPHDVLAGDRVVERPFQSHREVALPLGTAAFPEEADKAVPMELPHVEVHRLPCHPKARGDVSGRSGLGPEKLENRLSVQHNLLDDLTIIRHQAEESSKRQRSNPAHPPAGPTGERTNRINVKARCQGHVRPIPGTCSPARSRPSVPRSAYRPRRRTGRSGPWRQSSGSTRRTCLGSSTAGRTRSVSKRSATSARTCRRCSTSSTRPATSTRSTATTPE